MLVRIKPFDKKRGFVCRRYTFGGVRYEELRGWYEVSDEVARQLKAKSHSPPGFAEQIKIFDVATMEKAKALEKAEQHVEDPRASAGEPNVTKVSQDLTSKEARESDTSEPETDVGPEPSVPEAEEKPVRKGRFRKK